MRKMLIVLTLIVVGLVSGCASSPSGRAAFSMDRPAYEMYHGSDTGNF